MTGKGGTGKTTVAAALAMALASEGQRVLLAEVEGRQGISQTFDVPQLDIKETRVARGLRGGEVVGLSIDAKAALLEYLQMFYKLGRAGGVLEKFGVIDFATTIAPGVRDVLLIGKVYEAVRRREGGRRKDGALLYDAVVLDAPPTGRVGRFLNVNHEVAGLAKVGPIRQQADSITAMLRSSQTVVHLVTLLEEMPVQETIDAAAELDRIGLQVGGVVINQEREPALSPAAIKALRSDLDATPLEKDLAEAGLRVGPVLVDGLIQTGLDLADRLDLEVQERDELTGLNRPTYHLPLLHEGLDAGGLRELAGSLIQQGMV
ncbi:ATPase [Luteipulveratus mongoliensis]|uniref:ATPase n=1 Tax=Luteipulveratus mongoliensis TaxID=571913 RepID=A0A0K1JRA5_9MICO|nr:ATPase [Luteipulveratus mongoliensis]